jgi:uncharacterized protein YjdB
MCVRLDTVQKTFSTYANGVELGTGVPMTSKVSAAMESVDNLAIMTGSNDLTHFYVDNIAVSKIEVSTDLPETPDTGKVPADLDAIDFVRDGWKIQLPIENPNKPGSVMEVSPEELAAGYSSEFFYVDKDDNGRKAVVFRTPVQGYKTGNTSYTRSELREMIDPNNSRVNWSYAGTHTLRAEQRVTHVSSRGRTITSQIHGIEKNGDNANPLVKVFYVYDHSKETGEVWVQLKNTTAPTSADFTYVYPDVDLGEIYTTEIQVVDGAVYVTIETEDSEPQTYSHDFLAADPNWANTLYYFKLGNYIQDNADSGSEAYADVWVYDSSISHTEEVVKTSVESISIDNSELVLAPGERTALTYSVEPIKAYNKSVIWSVENGSDVVAVDRDGNVTAIKEGEATIVATSVDNPTAKDSLNIKVEAKEAVQAELIYETDFTGDVSGDITSIFNTDTVHVVASEDENASVKLVNENGNYVVQFKDDTHTAPAKMGFVFDKLQDTVTVQLKLRLDRIGINKAGSQSFGRLYSVVAGSDDWYSNTTELFRIRNFAEGNPGNFTNHTYVLSNAYDPIQMNPEKAMVDLGEWLEVTYIVTPDNGTAQANTTDMYMNGYPVGLNLTNRNVLPYVNRFDIQSGTGDTIDFSIDDLKIYKGRMVPEMKDPTMPQSIRISSSPSVMEPQGSSNITAQVEPAGSIDTLRYAVVEGDSVVVSNDGVVTAIKPGTSIIRISSLVDPTLFIEQEIKVLDKNSYVPVEKIEFTEPAITVEEGESKAVSVLVLPENASEKGVRYEITSGFGNISISSDGIIKGLNVGQAEVSVYSLANAALMDKIQVNVLSNIENGEMIYENDFSGDLSGAEWSISTANYTSVRVEDGVMIVEDGNNAGQPRAMLKFSPVSDLVSIQFDIKTDGEVPIQGGIGNTEYKTLRISYGLGELNRTANEAFTIRSNGEHYTYNVSGSEYLPILGDYHVKDWNTITMVAHIHPDGPDTTDIYVNGVLVLEGLENKVDYAAIDTLCFAAQTANFAKYNIANLKIWKGNLEDMPGQKPEPEETREDLVWEAADDAVWEPQKGDWTVKANGSLEDLLEVWFDNEIIYSLDKASMQETGDYKLNDGSTILTLKKAFLERQKEGKHEVRLVFAKGDKVEEGILSLSIEIKGETTKTDPSTSSSEPVTTTDTSKSEATHTTPTQTGEKKDVTATGESVDFALTGLYCLILAAAFFTLQRRIKKSREN